MSHSSAYAGDLSGIPDTCATDLHNVMRVLQKNCGHVIASKNLFACYADRRRRSKKPSHPRWSALRLWMSGDAGTE